MKKLMVFLSLLSGLLVLMTNSQAQEVLLDQMQQAGGLKLFPVYGDPKKFYYLPDKVIIPNGPNGKKQFSFLKFTDDSTADGEGGIQEAAGGGLVSFLVSFKVDKQTLQRAESELKSKVSGARIAGPITYREGTFALVSNFQQEDGDWTQRVVGVGAAPVLEDHAAGVSIRLTKLGATILWESFQQAASDITVSFDMTISGYRNPYEARMVAWWDKIARNKSLNIGSRTNFLGVDVQNVMRELRDEGAIEVEVKGDDVKMDRLWEMAYGKISTQMFEQNNDPITLATLQDDPSVFSNFEAADQFNTRVRGQIAEENEAERERESREREDLLAYAEQWQLLGDMARSLEHGDGFGHDGDGGAAGAGGGGAAGGGAGAPGGGSSNNVPTVTRANIQTPPSFSLLASYRKKEFKKSGKFELNFKKWTADTQAMPFDANIGGFAKKMLSDPAHFRIINLDRPEYKLREVLVQLDGQNAVDFEKYVNFVTVAIRKTHQDGFKHHKELKIDRNNFTKSSNNFSMTYGFHGDTDRDRWKQFDYKVTWNLFGGSEWSTDWVTTDDFMILASPPHKYRVLTVEADPQVFADNNIRLATVNLKFNLFGKEDVRQITLRPNANGTLSQIVKYAHEPGKFAYDYDITWKVRGQDDKALPSTSDDSQVLFADELPE